MVLQFQNAGKSFGVHPAVRELSLTVSPGDFVGLIGPNGAGKTTTLRMGVGHLVPDHGDVLIDGKSVPAHPIEARRRIGYVPEDIPLYDYLTGAEYLEFAGELKGMNPGTRRKEIETLLDILELGEERGRLIRTYSQGMRRKVAMAGALLGHPPFLVLDEAMNGLDPTTLHRLKGYLKTLVDQGMAILLSSHVLEVLERLCNRIVVMNQGRLVEELDSVHLEAIRQTPGGLEHHFMQRIAPDRVQALQAPTTSAAGKTDKEET